MLIMPQVVDTNPTYPEAFREMRAYGLNQLAPAGTRFDQLHRIEGGLQIFSLGVTTLTPCSHEVLLSYGAIKPLSTGAIPRKSAISVSRWLMSCGRAASKGKA